MKVQISVTGYHPRPEVIWPADWPLPRVGEEIEIEDKTLFVRHIVYYPKGDLEALANEPFVYIVVGPRII